MSDERYEAGMRVRRKVLGDAHVDRATARITDLDREFQTQITEGVWGSIWTRPHFDHRTRSLLTLVILASLGHWEEFAMHIRATANTGATPEDIREAILHASAYAGVPVANRAFAIAKEELGKMAPEKTAGAE